MKSFCCKKSVDWAFDSKLVIWSLLVNQMVYQEQGKFYYDILETTKAVKPLYDSEEFHLPIVDSSFASTVSNVLQNAFASLRRLKCSSKWKICKTWRRKLQRVPSNLWSCKNGCRFPMQWIYLLWYTVCCFWVERKFLINDRECQAII